MADATPIGRVRYPRWASLLGFGQADGRNSTPGGAWTGAPCLAS